MNIQLVSCIHTYAPIVPCNVMLEIDNHDNCSDFLKKWSAALLSMHYAKSAVLAVSTTGLYGAPIV